MWILILQVKVTKKQMKSGQVCFSGSTHPEYVRPVEFGLHLFGMK